MPGHNSLVYEGLAQAFVAEGTDTLFTLLGDGNMHWASALSKYEQMRIFHTRHEHCACAMAMGYSLATGKVGVASVTCGPGFTQTMTALATASRSGIPLVVFAGESPIGAAWYSQAIDQAPLAHTTGAHYISAHSVPRMLDQVREAFYLAQFERKPVVLGVPYDLQKEPLPQTRDYQPSSTLLPRVGRIRPDPAFVEAAASKIAASKYPIFIAGRGAMLSDAARLCEELADICGGLLATTLPMRGLFDHNEFTIGIAGGYSTPIAREMFDKCDLVVAVGASLANYTADGGRLYPGKFVVQIDTHPLGVKDGLRAADIYVQADAKIAVEEIIRQLKRLEVKRSDWRTPELARRLTQDSDPAIFDIEPGTLDPRRIVPVLDRVLPKDWEIVMGSGHNTYFSSLTRGRSPEHFHTARDFGAIGNGLSYAIGVAAAKPGATVVLFDGDGGFLMHAQELDTIRRHRLKILVCVMNDGGFGAEFHKLRVEGIDDKIAIFGRSDLASIARGFGLRGNTVTDPSQFASLCEAFAAGDTGEVWDLQISDQVVKPTMRPGGRRLFAAH